MLDSEARAKVDQSVRLPDFFSCKSCVGYDKTVYRPSDGRASTEGWVNYCDVLREENRCRIDLLRLALQNGAISIVMPLGQQVPDLALLESGQKGESYDVG